MITLLNRSAQYRNISANMEYERSQAALLRERLAEPPKTIQAVFGPRQSGKTTIVKQALRTSPHRYYYYAVDALGADETSSSDIPAAPSVEYGGERDRRWLVTSWEHARAEADRHDGCILVLDEIQHIPDWSRTVKGLWEGDRSNNLPLRVVVLGSAPMAIQSSLNESLMGRFELIRVGHWSFTEMADAFDFDLPQYVFFGGYPGAASLASHWPPRWSEYEDRWREYIREAIVRPTIDRDVLAMTRVDKPPLLRQAFDLAVRHSGQMLPYHKMLGRLQDAGNATTVARYVDLLSAAGLLTGLENYSANVLRMRRSTPKFNALNTALVTSASNYGFVEAQDDRTLWGRLVESTVGAHLLNTAGSVHQVHYWRDKDGNEVDFVMTAGPQVVGIEVKSGTKVRTTHGMRVFNERFGPHRTLLVAPDDTTPGTVPLAEFLSRPATDWFEDGE